VAPVATNMRFPRKDDLLASQLYSITSGTRLLARVWSLVFIYGFCRLLFSFACIGGVLGRLYLAGYPMLCSSSVFLVVGVCLMVGGSQSFVALHFRPVKGVHSDWR
jgi:hypothetical protein